MSEGMFVHLTDNRFTEPKAVLDITCERDRQQKKWGVQTHSIAEWLMILGEEYGEACKAGGESYFRDDSLGELRKELTQTAAVALAIIEGIDDKEGTTKGISNKEG